MQMIETSKLKSHPKNKEFFDDITGEKWKDFIKSIVRRGIVEAIVVEEEPTTRELIIVSGHQRVRGAKEIGILEVPCRIVHYPDYDEKTGTPREDMILEDLICTNIMQRGVGNVNPMKMAKCIKELERIYGIKNGGSNFSGNQYIKKEELGNNFVAPNKSQDDLAKQIGIDQRQLQNYKKLNELIPELQSLVETGALKSTTAYKIWAKMPQEEQEKFFNDIGQEKIKQMTQRETKIIIDKINEEKQQLEEDNKKLHDLKNNLIKELEEEKNKKSKVVTKTIEVDKTDYTMLKKNKELEKQLQELEKEKNKLQTKLTSTTNKAEAYKQNSMDYEKFKNDIIYLTKQKNDLNRQIQAITDISGLVVEIDHLLKKKLAPIKYSKSLLEAKDDEIVINNLNNIINTVEGWCYDMKKYIPNKVKYVDVEVM